MTDYSSDTSLQAYARTAGFAYIATMMLGMFSVGYVESNLIVPGNDAATVNAIAGSEGLFRVGVFTEVTMFVLVILLAVALYVVLRTVNEHLALLALVWRIGEAVTGSAVAVLSGLVPLLILGRDAALEPEQLRSLVGMFLETRAAGLDIVLIFIGMGGTVFCYLFFRSRYIPRPLAVWGIFTYLSMLAVSSAGILVPHFAETIRMALFVPGGLFELILGFWLLIKGVNLQPRQPPHAG